jgi:peptide/nickel transport system permease protein
MLRYTIRRLVYMLPILLGITLLTFLLFNVAGGDPAAQAAGRYATVEQIAVLKAQLGLDKSLPVQYIEFLKQIFTLDFGRSWSSQQKISTLILAGIGPSLSITLPAFLITLFITVPLALVLAHMRKTILDRAILIFCLALTSLSSLVYVLAGQYFLAYKGNMFPISGWDTDLTRQFGYALLPIIIFVAIQVGADVLFFRTVFMEEMFADYVRTARSKGLSNTRILFKHVLANGMIPIITLTVLQIPFLITGSILVESFFGIPGVGGLIVQAINNADFPVIKAMTVMSAIFYMIFQLVSDLLYAVVDPKVRLE